MKTRKKFLHLFIVLMGLLMLFGTGMTVSAAKLKKSVRIKGVEYDLFSDRTATARIEKVRGNDLPTELYIPKMIKYKKVKYKVEQFYWSDDSDKYMDWRVVDSDEVWKKM